ncbi:MAG: glycosyl hydrolase [Planctomycetaceae bacterium]|nr:glycosyl hydrolase [Planctomycetaceae bacterium]
MNFARYTLLMALLPPLAMVRLHAREANTLTAADEQAGFDLLFDGKSLDGWQQSGNWKVEGDAIAREGKGGSLVYSKRKIPDDFELRFEWKVGKGSNSGVYYRPGQYEYQILDNAVHVDGRNPRTSAASIYFCMAPSHDATKPAGEWNVGRIVCKGTVVQHWLNGKKVIHLDYADPKWKDNVELLRLRGGDLAARGANLSLQDHGDPVWYRSIKLRELGSDDQIDSVSVEPATISPDVLRAEQKKLKGILERRKKAPKK